MQINYFDSLLHLLKLLYRSSVIYTFPLVKIYTNTIIYQKATENYLLANASLKISILYLLTVHCAATQPAG
jgi:hypothetical protein